MEGTLKGHVDYDKAIEERDIKTIFKDKEALRDYLRGPVKKGHTHEKGNRLVNIIKVVHAYAGYQVKIIPGHDKGKDLNISDKNGTDLEYIQAKNLDKKLSEDDTEDAIKKIQRNYKVKKNTKIVVYSTAGFTKEPEAYECNSLPEIELLCFDKFFDHLASLADPKGSVKSKLYDYNKPIAKKGFEYLSKYKKLYLNLPPSFGKSFIIDDIYLQNYYNKKMLWVTPSTTINKNISENINTTIKSDNINFITYKKLYIDLVQKKVTHKADLIILDEGHRIGAPTFEKAVKKLMEDNPDAYIIMATASNERTDGREMQELLLSTKTLPCSKFTISITLKEAIDQGIIACPDYVIRGYNYNAMTDEIYKELIKNCPESKQTALKKDIQTRTKDWDNVISLDKNIKIDFKPTSKPIKGIIFCESIVALNANKDALSKAFRQSNKNIPPICYQYTSKQKESKSKSQMAQEFSDFQSAKTNTYHLLFVVDKLNEGVHVKPDFILLLRTTRSPVLFLQQLGRVLRTIECLQAWDQMPAVYDYVNNLDISGFTFFKEHKDACDKKNKIREKLGIPKKKVPVCFKDRIFKKTDDLVNELGNKYSSWMDYYEVLKNYVVKNNMFPKDTYICETTSLRIGKWLNSQRAWFTHYIKLAKTKKDLIYDKSEIFNLLKKHGVKPLQLERFTLLDKLGIPWFPKRERSIALYSLLLEYLSIEHKTPPQSKIFEGAKIGVLAANYKRLYKLGKLNDTIIQELKIREFDFGVSKTDLQAKWFLKYNECKLFFIKNNRLPRKTEPNYNWVRTQYSVLRGTVKGSLSKERKILLEKIGFKLNQENTKDKNDKQWLKMFKLLKEFISKYNRFPKTKEDYKGVKLGGWCGLQRTTINKGKLKQTRYDLLRSINFPLGKTKSKIAKSWHDNYTLLKIFIKLEQRLPTALEEFNKKKLGSWLVAQRVRLKKGILLPERIKLLDSLDFNWNPK
ncbi:MAG: Helicase associated domain protein [bacterium]